jgi:hypothetical protein
MNTIVNFIRNNRKIILVMIISFLLAFYIGLIYSTIKAKACDECQIRITYNDKEVLPSNGFPIRYNDRVLLGLRSTANMLGCDIKWDAKNKTATLSDSYTKVVVQADNEVAEVNGDKVTMAQAPIIIDGRLFVPVRFVAESFMLGVKYNSESNTVAINELPQHVYR